MFIDKSHRYNSYSFPFISFTLNLAASEMRLVRRISNESGRTSPGRLPVAGPVHHHKALTKVNTPCSNSQEAQLNSRKRALVVVTTLAQARER